MGTIIPKYEELDKRLIENSLALEGKIIGCLWKDPELFGEYDDLTLDSFITEDGQFYYILGQQMANKGYNTFDKVTVITYLEKYNTLKECFDKRGGYDSICEAMKSVKPVNTASYIDEIFKRNIMIEFQIEGFNIFGNITVTEDGKEKDIIPFDLFKNMNAQQVAEWYDWRLQSITMSKSMGNIKIVDLDIDDNFIKSCNAGEEMGLPYDILGEDIDGKPIWGSPITSSSTLGIHRGDAELIGAYSGKGKSSYVLSNRVYPIIHRGEKVCLMANEMTINKYQAILLAMVLSHNLKYYGLTRRHLKKGGFTEEQMKKIKEAQAYYRKHYYKNIKFVELDDYSMNGVKRVIKKLARQGVGYFIYDTFKSENMADANTRGQLIENSKTLYQLAKKYNIGMTIVMQLAIHTEGTRYLTSSCLSEAKGVKEVLSEIIIFRELWSDEYNGESYDVKPYRFIRDKKTGKYTKTKEFIQLDKDKKYRVFFLDKTRNDDDGKCILFQFDGAWNKWTEIGFCTPSHIDKRGK